MSIPWRAAYQRCLDVGVDADALTRVGRGIGGGTPSAQWNAGQQALADLIFSLTAAMVALFPQVANAFPALAAVCDDDNALAARWLVTVLDQLEWVEPASAQHLRRAVKAALSEPSDAPRVPGSR